MSMKSGYIISCANIAVIEGFTQQREVQELSEWEALELGQPEQKLPEQESSEQGVPEQRWQLPKFCLLVFILIICKNV